MTTIWTPSLLPHPLISSFLLFLSKSQFFFPWLYFIFWFLFPYLSPTLYCPPSQELVGLPPSLPPCECHYPRDIRKISRCKQKHKSLCFSVPTFFSSVFFSSQLRKYFCMFSHLQRLRVEDMKSEANKTSACFSLVTNSTINLLNSRIYHVTVHDSGSHNCSCIVYILSQSLSDNLGLIILVQQSYGCHLIKSISHATRHLEVSEESPDTDLAFIFLSESNCSLCFSLVKMLNDKETE